MIIIDAMVLTYFLLRHSGFTEEVDPIFKVGLSCSAPPLWRSELRNALLQYVRATDDPEIPGSDLDVSGAIQRMRDAEMLLGNQTISVDSEDVLRLAEASGCTAYDCEYVALAQDVDVKLVTYDRDVLEAFPDTAVHPAHFA